MTEDDLKAVVLVCPNCGHEDVDLSDHGFHYCEKCAYCTHLVYWKRQCIMCGQEESLMRLKVNEDFDEAERAVLMACRKAHDIGICPDFVNTPRFRALGPAADRLLAYGLIRWANGGPDMEDGYHLTENGEYHADRLLAELPKGVSAVEVAEDVARRLARKRPDDQPLPGHMPLLRWYVIGVIVIAVIALLLAKL